MRGARPFDRVVVALSVAIALASISSIPSLPDIGEASSSGGCGCSMRVLSMSVTPTQSIGAEVNYTFYGHAAGGWGFSNATIADPGPNLTVYIGDIITLTLIANDTAPHNWFIDYNDNLQPDAGEPSSPDFNAPGGPRVIVWNFTADRSGTWTYRCRYHPTSMTGTIQVLPEGRPQNRTFYGHSVRGWGLSNVTITDPGPEMVVGQGALVTLTLIANDTAPHNWFIDYNDNLQPDAGEPSSPDFNAPGGPRVIVWNFTADRPGEFTYRCRYHPTTMTGTIIILGEERPVTGGLGVGLVPGIMILTLGFVLVFAAVYHVRAVRASKRMK